MATSSKGFQRVFSKIANITGPQGGSIDDQNLRFFTLGLCIPGNQICWNGHFWDHQKQQPDGPRSSFTLIPVLKTIWILLLYFPSDVIWRPVVRLLLKYWLPLLHCIFLHLSTQIHPKELWICTNTVGIENAEPMWKPIAVPGFSKNYNLWLKPNKGGGGVLHLLGLKHGLEWFENPDTIIMSYQGSKFLLHKVYNSRIIPQYSQHTDWKGRA